MTPDLMEQGAERRAAYAAKQQSRRSTESGGRDASYGRIARVGLPDFTQGVALYLDDITVSFDGFRALNKLSLTDPSFSGHHFESACRFIQQVSRFVVTPR